MLRREAREEEKRSRRRVEGEQRRDRAAKSLFDLINVRLGPEGKAQPKAGPSGARTGAVPLKEESNKNLKIRQFEMSEKMARVEKEVNKLNESYARLKDKDPKSAQSVKAKIDQKSTELKTLQQKEKRLDREEGSRKSKSKLAIF